MQDHQKLNRQKWQGQADWYAIPAEENWKTANAKWGIWGIPEEDLNLLPDDLTGKSCLEIGCGAAYVSAWMARRGGSVVGIDPTPNQLSTATRLEAQYQTGIHLVEGFGESLPFRDATFDFAISEYGAALWADPYQWIPEAARVLKSNGVLVLMVDHLLAFVTAHTDEEIGQTRVLHRSYFDSYRMRWSEEDGIEFHLTHGDWIDLFRENGFEIMKLQELAAPEGATSRYKFSDAEWSKLWPSEEVWTVRKT